MIGPHTECRNQHPSERPRYFYGQMLVAEDLQAEQAYFIDKDRAHNRLHGWGTVCGLEVMPTRPPTSSVVVQPGIALDCCGRDLVLTRRVQLDVADVQKGTLGRMFVVIEYGEEEVAQAPGPPGEPSPQATRIREVPTLSVAARRPEAQRGLSSQSSGIVPCSECRDSVLTLAVIALEGRETITAEAIDDTRRIIPNPDHIARQTGQRSTGDQRIDGLRRRTTALTAAVAVLAVGVVVSLLRRRVGVPL